MEILSWHVLFSILWSIHLCHWLQLWIAVACCYHAPNLLNNVSVSLFTWSSLLPCVLLVIHAPYDYAIAMLSFIFMPSYCWLPCHAMYCSVVSGSSSPTCLLIVVSAMSCYFHQVWICHITCYVYMGAIISSVPFWLVISRGLWLYAISRFMPCLFFPW